jgi:hypothetical protein
MGEGALQQPEGCSARKAQPAVNARGYGQRRAKRLKEQLAITQQGPRQI